MTPSDGQAAPQRLHPMSLLFSIGSAVRRLLLPGIALLFFSGGSNYEFVLMFFFVPAAVTALVRYLTYRYRLGAGELMIRDGVLTRNERHIPYARIQNVNLVQNPFHRMLQVAEVHIETASGSKPEAIIRVLSLRAIERLRDRVFSERGGAADSDASADEPEPPLLELPVRELVLLGLISNRGMAVIAALMGLLWQFDLWEFDLESIGEQLPAWTKKAGIPIESPGVGMTILLGLLTLIVLIVLMRLLSIGWSILRFYGFSLRRSGRDLRTRYGLFTRYTAVIPSHRIQLLSSHATPLHRLWNRSGLLAETAGGGAGDDEQATGTHRLWLAPLIASDRVHGLQRHVLPDVDLSTAEWNALPRRAHSRIRNRSLFIVALLVLIGAFAFGWWTLVTALVGLPWALVHAALWWKHAAWAELPAAIAFRSGWWTRRTSVVRFAKIQTVSLGQSPFDRRHAMAWLSVDTAGAGKAGHRVRIPFLPIELARALSDRLGLEAAQRDFRW